jgi:alpha-beta hydrolase superfamily lysophospholipase
MKHFEGDFRGIKDLKIYYQAWFPDNKPKAIVQIAHGFAEHSGRYLNVVNALVPLNYAIYANDHRGHGKSEGLTNFVDSFEQYIEDAKLMYDIIKKNNPDLPVFMLGHSMGSGIAIYFTKKYENLLKGLILSGTGTLLGTELSGFLKFMAKLLSKVAKKTKVDPKLDPKTLSHDPKVVKAYEEDSLVHYKIVTARLGYEMMTKFSILGTIVRDFKLPMLIQRGSEDLAVKGFEAMKKELKMNAEIHEYTGLFHEVFNELEKDRKQVLNDLCNWLEKQFNK